MSAINSIRFLFRCVVIFNGVATEIMREFFRRWKVSITVEVKNFFPFLMVRYPMRTSTNAGVQIDYTILIFAWGSALQLIAHENATKVWKFHPLDKLL